MSSIIVGCLAAIVFQTGFDEGQGEVAKDTSGNQLDAKLVNCTWEKRGLHGKCVRLNGENAYIALPQAVQLDFTNEFTWSIWYKTAKITDRSKVRFALFGRGGYNYWTTSLSGTYAAIMSKPSGNAIHYGDIPRGLQVTDPWVHMTITGTREQAGLVVRFYLNGRLCARCGVSSFPLKAALPTTTKFPFTIGKFLEAEAAWFNGIIDNVTLYDHALTHAEVTKEHEREAKMTAEEEDVKTVELRHIEFAPLKRTRVAVFVPNEAAGGEKGMVRSSEWVVNALKANGCQATVIRDKELCDVEAFNAKKYDTLIMLRSVMPYLADDTIFQFLSDGGNLVTTVVDPATYKELPDGTLDSLPREGKFRHHNYGWYAPFLLRANPAPHLFRQRLGALALDERAVDLTGDLLPAKIAANPKKNFRPLDRWDKTPGFEGSYGDPANYALSADQKFALYAEGCGIGADFAVYRYRNALLNRATLVQLGTIGEELLKSENGENVLKAVLHLLEAKLPGQQSEEFYATAIQAQREWGEFSFEFEDAYATLRDAAAFTHTLGGNWQRYTKAIDELEVRRATLEGMRKRQVKLLWSNSDLPTAEQLGKDLIAGLAAFRKDFAGVLKEAKAVIAKAKTPTKPVVKSEYGTLPSIASQAFPMSLNRARRRLFKMIKRVGSNIWSGGGLDRWQTEDKLFQEEFKGMKRDFKFSYASEASKTTGCGSYNPTTGTVTEGKDKEWPYAVASNDIARLIRMYAAIPTNQYFRIGTGDETGLGLLFWDSNATRQFHAFLKNRYKNDLAAMNAEMMSDYKSFEEVKLPMHQPTTPVEHALWENWRNCREQKLTSGYYKVYDIVKQQCPALKVFTLPSLGALSSPLFAVDYYKVAACGDNMFGLDGTCGPVDKEWVYADLSGKPFLTSEWGGLYQEASVQYVHSKLWQEIVAGSLGCEQHVWASGSESCGYVDELDLATPYAGMLKSVLDAARKFDWMFLDGKRAVPEVAILFSQCSRMHDQGWGYGGAPRLSEHFETVCYYYRQFLSWGHSTRVLDEYRVQHEADLLNGVKALLVPQALYLDEVTQLKLLDFAKQGGTLVLEGKVGAFTPFGKESYLIFKTAGIMPFATEKPVRMAYGKGAVVFLGQDAGKEKQAAFPSLLEGVLRESGIGERIACSDDKLVIREWVYEGRHFLTLVSMDGTSGKDWGEHEVEIAVRGKLGVADYLLGAPVKTTYRDGYTVFKTLAVNGGRVLELSAAPAEPNAEAMKRASKHPIVKAEKKTVNTTKLTTLPFSGHFFDETPLTDGEYTFTLSTISEGRDRHQGETFLIVTGGNESLKKRIFENVPTYFPMRRATYRVTSRDNFCMFPFYADALIERVNIAEPANKAKVETDKTGKVSMKGDFIEAMFLPNKGVEMCSFKLHNEQYEQLAEGKAYMIAGAMPGAFRNSAFTMEPGRIKNGVTATFRQKEPSQGLTMVQTVAMADDKAELYIDSVIKNVSGDVRPTEIVYHPELTIGTSADASDHYVVPRKGMPNYDDNFRGRGGPVRVKPLGADWAAIVDAGEKLAFVARFDYKSALDFYIYEASDFYTLELETPKQKLEANASMRHTLRYQIFRGLSGIDDVQGDFAANVVAKKYLNQMDAIKLPLEVSSTRRNVAELAPKAVLKRGDETVAELKVTGDNSVAFNQNANLALTAKLSALADGAYTLEVQIGAGVYTLKCVKSVELVGNRAADILKRIESMRGKATDFTARVALFNAEQAAKNGDIAEAEKQLATLEK